MRRVHLEKQKQENRANRFNVSSKYLNFFIVAFIFLPQKYYFWRSPLI